MQVNPKDAQRFLGEDFSFGKGRDNLTFREACMLIQQKEGPKGFLRGFNAAMIKNFSTAGTYFSFLHFAEEHLKSFGLGNTGST
jgi:hypothetical protein